QDGANRDGIGAWIEVKVGDTLIPREITSGGGHAGGQVGWWHFGLGAATSAQLRVTWPDGTTGDWMPVEADTFYVAAPGKAPATWSAG
ncbi:MAG: ASPIC/UnbV domain-containing protein, partial [Devosia sp.]